MSASFLLGLDTTAPQVTFGAISGAEAGQLLQVGYTIDEPEVTAAEFRPRTGAPITLDVFSDHVEGLLPPATVGGNGHLRLTVVDDVGNEAVRSLTISITSPVGPPSAPPGRGAGITPTAPGRRQRGERHEVVRRSRVRVVGRRAVRNVHIAHRTLHIAMHGSRFIKGESSTVSAVEVASRRRLQATAKVATGIGTSASREIRRREGPDEEALLLELL